MNKVMRFALVFTLLLTHSHWVSAAIDGQVRLKPFTLAYETAGGDIAAMTKKVESLIMRAFEGFFPLKRRCKVVVEILLAQLR